MYPPMPQNPAMLPQNPATRPTPQQLAAGLQMGQMPMSMQRQPQGGLAGPSVQTQMPNQFTTRGIQVR